MSNYEETNPRDIPLDVVETALRKFFPAITRKEIIFFYHGTYNVFRVKQDYIFRFPDKSLFGRKGFDLIQRENEVLNLLRSYLSISIPKFVYLSSDAKTPFVGYRKISGQSLSQVYSKATEEQKKDLGKQIGLFLSELHSPEVHKVFAEKKPSSFSPAIYQDQWHKFFQETQQKLFPLFSRAQKKWVTGLFTAFLEDSSNFHFTPRVIHGDFDTTNIIVNPISFHITGIIDFEDTKAYDPVGDFLFLGEGMDFLQQILANYNEAIDSNFPHRMDFHEGRIPLTYLLTGYNLNYPRMVEAGFEMLKARMRLTNEDDRFSPYSDHLAFINANF